MKLSALALLLLKFELILVAVPVLALVDELESVTEPSAGEAVAAAKISKLSTGASSLTVLAFQKADPEGSRRRATETIFQPAALMPGTASMKACTDWSLDSCSRMMRPVFDLSAGQRVIVKRGVKMVVA